MRVPKTILRYKPVNHDLQELIKICRINGFIYSKVYPFPLEQIAIIKLTDPVNKEFWISNGCSLKPQE